MFEMGYLVDVLANRVWINREGSGIKEVQFTGKLRQMFSLRRPHL